MPLLEDLESFVQLAALRNFGHAARRLGITTSSLSRRMQALERELGHTLLRRSTRSVELTEQGRQVLGHVERLLETVHALRSDLKVNSQRVAGLLRVGAPVDLAIAVLGPTLARFCAEYPAIRLNFVATQGQPDLRNDPIDVAFAVVHQRPMPDSAFTLTRVGQISRMLFASARYLADKGTPRSPKELSAHRCVVHLADRAESEWELRDGSRRARVAVSGSCATTSLANAAQAAEAGLGIVLLPAHMARTAAKGGLVRILEPWEGTPALIFAVTERKQRSARVSALLEWARAHVPARVAALDA